MNISLTQDAFQHRLEEFKDSSSVFATSGKELIVVPFYRDCTGVEFVDSRSNRPLVYFA